MSEPRIRAAKRPEFSAVWTDVFKLGHKSQEKKPDRQMPRTGKSFMCAGLQSPRQQGYSRNSGLHNAESPGDVEVSQDIVWDSTSPTQANIGQRSTRVVPISDIVNRIAPKDVRPKGSDPCLLQWIGDGAIPCTPEIPRQRLRKKSSRQSSVDDLVKLARQFDENMQQDANTSEQCNAVKNDLEQRVDTSETKPTQPLFSGKANQQKCPSSSSEQAEAELHALFDSSTQGTGGWLSECSGASAGSQDIKNRSSTKRQQSIFQPGDESGSAAKGSCASNANNCDDFEDDWENDDLLNDPSVLAMTQNPNEPHDANAKITSHPHTKTNSAQFTSVSTDSAPQSSRRSHSALQELCPKPKTINRSTFKLQSNPYFQAKEVSKSGFTAVRPDVPHQTPSASQTNRIPGDHSGAHSAAESVQDISDSLWDDGDDDDALLYQVCDNVERISNSQPQQSSSTNRQEKQGIAAERGKQNTESLPVDTAWTAGIGASANRQSSRASVLSNSLPGTSCETTNYQGWNIPTKGSNNRSHMSQSFPGSHTNLGTFSQRRDSSGNFQAGTAKVDLKLRTGTPGAPQGSKSLQTTFKRNLSDSAAISSKVFVTSQARGRCTAAEIERKKQEALARRRQRLQNAPHHKAAP